MNENFVQKVSFQKGDLPYPVILLLWTYLGKLTFTHPSSFRVWGFKLCGFILLILFLNPFLWNYLCLLWGKEGTDTDCVFTLYVHGVDITYLYVRGELFLPVSETNWLKRFGVSEVSKIGVYTVQLPRTVKNLKSMNCIRDTSPKSEIPSWMVSLEMSSITSPHGPSPFSHPKEINVSLSPVK